MESKTPQKKIWFFDDDHDNTPTSSQKEYIKFIKIPGSKEKIKHENVHERFNNQALSKLDNDQKAYFPDSGVKTEHLEDINKNIENVRALVFDWDKTFILFEGFSFGRPSHGVKTLQQSYNFLKKNKYISFPRIEDFLEYILHDKNDDLRVENLMKTLQLAQEKDIPIFILTNNPMGRNQRQIFVDVFTLLGVDVPLEHIFKGGLSGPKRKGVTIMENLMPIIKRFDARKEAKKKARQESSAASAASAGLVEASSSPMSTPQVPEDWLKKASKIAYESAKQDSLAGEPNRSVFGADRSDEGRYGGQRRKFHRKNKTKRHSKNKLRKKKSRKKKSRKKKSRKNKFRRSHKKTRKRKTRRNKK